MYKKLSVIAVTLSLLLLLLMGGCAKKHVRHLASDAGLVTPGTTTKEKVVSYLGLPDAEYKMNDGSTLWVYYEESSSLLRDTPYVGEKIGEESYEVVKVTFSGDVVQTIVYRTMGEEEFAKTGYSE